MRVVICQVCGARRTGPPNKRVCAIEENPRCQPEWVRRKIEERKCLTK
jgi:hypothetical protein